MSRLYSWLLEARSTAVPTYGAFHSNQEKLSHLVVGAFIRLGRKYNLQYLFDSAVARLRSHNSTTLEEYDALKRTESTIQWEYGLKFDLINMASENEIYSALSKIKKFQPGDTLAWIRKWEFDGCIDLERCRTSRESYLDHVDEADVDALASTLQKAYHCEFCAARTRRIAEFMAVRRKKILEELPEIFDLPPWDELKDNI
ncbi:hypothetical protein K438DRAFT_1953763 [Mycena galopus ATCC 62051]|nr:hypothetical protein K438DRAFT_1953763 [Mycena galopus ATCC 62051]